MNIEGMSIEDIQEGYRTKKFTSKEIVRAYFKRIHEYDDKINAFISLCEDTALAEAEIIDRKINNNENLNFFEGIPVAIKDLICTRGIKTTCASKMLENFIPPYDATIIKKLKKSGAIMIGKTNMDEFAMGSSTENSAFKITRNPWNIKKVPGGSSGGSAAAVSAGFAPLAIGSDTGGSIRQPAAFCGNVGLKPTYGLVSRYGLIAFASSLDQIGTFTKTVKDAAISLQVIQGHDSMDATSVLSNETNDYILRLEDGIKGMKFGLPKEFYQEGLNEEIKASIMSSVERITRMGGEVEEFSLPITDVGLSAYYIISSAEASANLARYDGIRYGYRTEDYSDVDTLMLHSRTEAFGSEVKRRIMMGTYVLSSGYYDAYYKKAMLFRRKVKNNFGDAFKKYDAIISPVSPVLPFDIGEKTDNPIQMYLSDIYTINVNIAGLPAISIPCGYSKNKLPIGLQLIGNTFEEEKLLKIAYALEQNLSLCNTIPKLKEAL